MFKDKILLITGGTGSFGNVVSRRCIDSDLKEIRIFSRDEKKQDDMRNFFEKESIFLANRETLWRILQLNLSM